MGGPDNGGIRQGGKNSMINMFRKLKKKWKIFIKNRNNKGHSYGNERLKK